MRQLLVFITCPARAANEWSMTLLALIVLHFTVRAASAQPVSREVDRGAAQAFIQSAAYTALIDGAQIVDGHAHWQVRRSGDGPAALNWTEVNLPIHNLAWPGRPAVWGTAPDGQVPVLVEDPAGELTADWNLRGEPLGEGVHFQLSLPPALDSRLTLSAPDGPFLTASAGLVTRGELDSAGRRQWTIELGRLSRCWLHLLPAGTAAVPVELACQTRITYLAELDGVGLDQMCDWTVRESQPSDAMLLLPKSLKLQSVTINDSQVDWGPLPGRSGEVRVALPRQPVGATVSLRVRGTLELLLSTRMELPRVHLRNALETRCEAWLRVEEPLQLRDYESPGYVPLDLRAGRDGPEELRLEARDREARVIVLLEQPAESLRTELMCLLDRRAGGNWAALVARLQGDTGSGFQTRVQLPAGWELVTTQSGEDISQVASVSARGRELEVTWSRPLPQEAVRTLCMFFSIESTARGEEFDLALPRISGSAAGRVECQFLLPPDLELRLLNSTGWRVIDEAEFLPEMLDFAEASQRLPAAADVVVTSLQSLPGNGPRSARILLAERPQPLDLQAAQYPSGALPVPAPGNGGNSPQAVDLRLTSSCGPYTDAPSAHLARMTFLGLVRADELEISLPVDAQLSTVSLDGIPVPVVRTQSGLLLPPESPPFQALEISYSTLPQSAWWTAEHMVPVPGTNFHLATFQWSIDMRGQLQLATVRIPGVIDGERSVEPIASCLFGPLTRSGSERLFRPWRALEWTTLFAEESETESFSPRRVFSEMFPTAAREVVLRTWNRRRALQWSWIAFWTGCLVVVWIRRSVRPHGGKTLLASLGALALLLVWIPPTATPVAGGAFVGMVLTLLFPRRWMRGSGPAVEFLAAPAAWPFRASLSTGVFLLGLGILEAQDSPRPPAADVDAREFPATLVRSVRYELTTLTPAPRIRARYDVLVDAARPVRWLPLPLENVTFAAPSVQVDGATAELAPALDGHSVLVSLAGSPVSENPGIVAPGYLSRSVDLEFDLPVWPRLAAIRDLERLPGLPRVIDSLITWPIDRAEVDFSSVGALQTTGPNKQLSLGPVSRLRAADSVPLTPPAGLQLATRLDLHPLNVEARTWVIPGPAGLPGELRLKLPRGFRPRSVSGAAVQALVLGDTSTGQAVWQLRLLDAGRRSTLELDWELSPEFSGGRLQLPALEFWGAQPLRHLLALYAPAAVALTVDDGGRTRQLPALEWPPAAEPLRGRPTLAVQLEAPRELPLIWGVQEPARTALIAETLEVEREALNWNAAVELTVSRAQAFSHRFLLDARVRLDSVLDIDEGGSDSLEFIRDGDIVSVFAPGGQPGLRELLFRGEIPTEVDRWTIVPQFALLDGVTTASTLEVIDRTGWLLDAEFEGLPLDPQRPDLVPVRLESRSRFPHGAARPWSLRTTLPPTAIRLDSVTRLRMTKGSDWEIQTQLRLSTADALLHQTTLGIPRALRDVRLLNDDVEAELVVGGDGDELRIRIPDRLAAAVTLTLTARYTPEPGPRGLTTLPLISVPAAQPGSRYLLIAESDPYIPDPVACLRVSGAAFPSWADAGWRGEVRSAALACYQQAQGGWEIPLRRRALDQEVAVIPLEETALWTLPDGRLAGVTRVWIQHLPGSVLDISHDGQTTIEMMQLDGRNAVNVERLPTGSRVRLSSRTGAASVAFYWTAPTDTDSWSLFRYSQVTPGQRLCAVIASPGHLPEAGTDAMLGLFNAWLLRWQALLQCLRDAAPAATIDESLLAGIRLSRNRSSSLLNASLGPTPPQQQGLYQSLTDQWARLQDELFLPASPLVDPRFPLADAFPLLLDRVESGAEVQLLALNPARESLPLRGAQREPSAQWLRVALSCCIVLVCAAGWRFPAALSQLRESMAANDLDSLLVLEGTWWGLLTWSGYAFLALVVTTAYIVVHRLGERWFPQEEKESGARGQGSE